MAKKEIKSGARKSLNQMIRDLIVNSNETVSAIAKESDISQSQLSRFINGERDLTLKMADRVCKALDCYFFEPLSSNKDRSA